MPHYANPADQLKACLADLEERLDSAEETALLAEWQRFSLGACEDDVFSPRRIAPNPAGEMWPAHVSVNAGLRDYDAMALQQFLACSRALASASGALLNVRANYGTSIIPLIFGVAPFVMDEALDTLPTSWPLQDVAAIERLVTRACPTLHQGHFPHVIEMAARYNDIAATHPKIGQHIFIYHPDLQGPMDICEVVWGSSMFTALVDRPDLVHDLLDVVTDHLHSRAGGLASDRALSRAGNAHWGLYHRGNIMIRDDSAMNLSPRMFAEFIRPYDQRLLDHFGGGAIHFCGRGDHYLPQVAEMPGVYAINLSQPECNDMERVFANTVDRGINIIGLPGEAAQAAVAAGRDLRGRVQTFL